VSVLFIAVNRQLFTNVFPIPLLNVPLKSQLIELANVLFAEIVLLVGLPLRKAPFAEWWVSLVRPRYIAVPKLLFEFHNLALKDRNDTKM
jgi:hypothetical protein